MKEGKVIAIANQKGGVGKTTATLNFGNSLSLMGYSVLMIDFDHQGNLTMSAGIEDFDKLEKTIANSIIGHIQGEDEELPIYKYRERIDFVPANIMLSSANLMMVQAMAREKILTEILKPIKDRYDYILIDCAPSLSIDLINALTAADEVLIITNPAKFSAIGTMQLVKSILKVKKSINKDIKIAGVLINKVDRRTNFAKDVIRTLKEDWGKELNIFETEIPNSIRVDESQAMGLSMSEYENTNKVTKAFGKFTEEYLGL